MPQSNISFPTFFLVKADASLATRALGNLVWVRHTPHPHNSLDLFQWLCIWLLLNQHHSHRFFWLELVRNRVFPPCISGWQFYVCISEVIHGIFLLHKQCLSVLKDSSAQRREGEKWTVRSIWIKSFLNSVSLLLFVFFSWHPTF